MGYLLLAGAIGCELFATISLKMSNGFSNLIPTICCIIGYVLSFACLGKALLTINLSIAYATWSALGIVLATILAALLFGDTVTPLGIFGMVLIIVGVVVLNLFGVPK